MLVQLQVRPDDAELRLRAAEALAARGKPDDAAAVLSRFVNLAGHDDDTGLPCLCKKCLAKAGTTAEAGGMKFERSFVVHGDRVLHFWTLAELADQRAQVRASVADALAKRLALPKRRRRR